MMRRLFLLLAVLLLPLPAEATGVYVVNFAGSVTSYPLSADGNVSPSTNITGASTGFSAAMDGICINPAATKIWVVDSTNNKLSQFAITDTGNVAPTVTISGGSTTLNGPGPCALDSSGNLWVTNVTGGQVLMFTAAHILTGGNIAPDQSFNSASISFPHGIALSAAANIYIANWGSVNCASANCETFEFANASSGTVSPGATWSYQPSGNHHEGVGISGTPKLFIQVGGLTGLTCPDGNAGDAIWIYNNIAASSSAAPDSFICGNNTQMSPGHTHQIAVDANGAIVSLNDSTGNPANQVNIFHAGASGDAAPDQIIVGAATNLNNPVAVAVVGKFATNTKAGGALWPFP